MRTTAAPALLALAMLVGAAGCSAEPDGDADPTAASTTAGAARATGSA